MKLIICVVSIVLACVSCGSGPATSAASGSVPPSEAHSADPLDAPPIEETKDVPRPAIQPARSFLADVPSVLALESGPGMPEDHPNLELFWKGEEIGAAAALAHEDAFSDSDGTAFVVFSCGEYELQISGPLDPGNLVNPQWLPVDPELIELILESYGDECRLR